MHSDSKKVSPIRICDVYWCAYRFAYGVYVCSYGTVCVSISKTTGRTSYSKVRTLHYVYEDTRSIYVQETI